MLAQVIGLSIEYIAHEFLSHQRDIAEIIFQNKNGSTTVAATMYIFIFEKNKKSNKIIGFLLTWLESRYLLQEE